MSYNAFAAEVVECVSRRDCCTCLWQTSEIADFVCCLNSVGYMHAYHTVSANTVSCVSQCYEKSDRSQDAHRGSPDIPNEPSH